MYTDLIECRRKWFNWWAGGSTDGLVDLPTTLHDHISWPLGFQRVDLITELQCPLGSLSDGHRPCLNLGQGENHPLTHDPYWSMVIPTRFPSLYPENIPGYSIANSEYFNSYRIAIHLWHSFHSPFTVLEEIWPVGGKIWYILNDV